MTTINDTTLDTNIDSPARRDFMVKTAAASSGLVLGFGISGCVTSGSSASLPSTEINIWVAIKSDDTVVVRIARSEMGQGTLTGLAQ